MPDPHREPPPPPRRHARSRDTNSDGGINAGDGVQAFVFDLIGRQFFEISPEAASVEKIKLLDDAVVLVLRQNSGAHSIYRVDPKTPGGEYILESIRPGDGDTASNAGTEWSTHRSDARPRNASRSTEDARRGPRDFETPTHRQPARPDQNQAALGHEAILRAIDLADVIGLIRANHLGASFAARIDKPLRAEFRKLVTAIRNRK